MCGKGTASYTLSIVCMVCFWKNVRNYKWLNGRRALLVQEDVSPLSFPSCSTLNSMMGNIYTPGYHIRFTFGFSCSSFSYFR